MTFATTPDGVRLYYETLGDGEEVLLFVSGQGGDHHDWDAIRDDFAKKYFVIVFDNRGTGQSDKPESPPYSTRGFAQDAITILNDLDIEKTYVYGISMGGRICQWLGIDYPERIGGLVLAATTPGNAHGIRRPSDVDAALSSGDIVKLTNELVSPEWAAKHPEFTAYILNKAKNPIPKYAQQLHYQASEGHDTWDLLPTIQAPTLVIHGTNDRVNVTANAPLLAGRIPKAELSLVKDGRHAFIEEFREETTPIVMDFLARHPLFG
ncbi:MAG: alpha/beta hydrolase [Chloroflexota bacterium]